MDWLYRLIVHDDFPDPLEEIAALAAIDDEGGPAFLMLQERKDAPGKGALPGDTFLLGAARPGEQFMVCGEAIVCGNPKIQSTPPSVIALYGQQRDRLFVPLGSVVVCEPRQVPLTALELKAFLRGQATAKQLGQKNSRLSPKNVAAPVVPPTAVPAFDPLQWQGSPAQPFVGIGLDPTAGTWLSGMTENHEKRMPSVALSWTGTGISFNGIEWHTTNESFWTRVRTASPALVCIDGPCATNGLRIRDWREWDGSAVGGTRDGEVELTHEGVSLYWTTHASVMRFKAASEWIARSLKLFEEATAVNEDFQTIETHPYGAFTFLWRAAGLTAPLPKKATPQGRAARLAMLKAFVPTLRDTDLVDHDAVDACVAAVVAVLHRLGLTRGFGTVAGG